MMIFADTEEPIKRSVVAIFRPFLYSKLDVTFKLLENSQLSNMWDLLIQAHKQNFLYLFCIHICICSMGDVDA